MKRITKKQALEFNIKISKILTNNKFTYSNEESYVSTEGMVEVYCKETNYGKLKITLPVQYGQMFSVFCKFEDVEKALRIFNCNKFTGKYNFHYDKDTEKVLISDFEWFMTELNFDIFKEENIKNG